jgi:two-component system, chemotaxis family, sensor histidine kinase and response regulator PixL
LEDIFTTAPRATIPTLDLAPVAELTALPSPASAAGDSPVFAASPAPERILGDALPTAVSATPPDRPTPKPAAKAATVGTTVKVDLNRLERLNNQIGELITQENGAILQVRQMRAIVATLTQRLSQFEHITRTLQDWNDRSQTAQARLHMAPVASGGLSSDLEMVVAQPEFDPLQMDNYSDLQLLMQGAIEEIAQFGEGMRDMGLLMQQAQQTQHQKQQTLKQAQNDLLWVRMLPLEGMLQRFPRMVRDLAANYHKQVTVKLSGTNTLVDKAILDKLYDPLVHLVRNAFDHGIETPDNRQAQGKSAEATIEIRAYYRGNQTYIEVRDDGQGINLAKVKAKAIALNLVSADEAEQMSSERLYDLLFSPGFSTAAKVSELSGRGVGLDTVRSQIRLLKGNIAIQSEPGKGTTFSLRLPLTLTVAKLLVCSVGSNLLALPMDSLTSILSVAPDTIKTIQGSQYYQLEGSLVPVYPKELFLQHYPIQRSINENLQSMALPQNGKIPLLIIPGESGLIALPVDQILQEQELVIKPFSSLLAPPPYLYGCTILGDGSLVPVVDGSSLVATTQPVSTLPRISPVLDSGQQSMILVVDDSLTARQTLCATLRKAGYQTLQARDGREALAQLQQHPTIQAVFCDVEMPNMNGFEFLTHCRQEFPKPILPVIMVTSRSGDKHRQIAQVLGASSYLTKPFLEQELLRTLKGSLPGANN